MSTLAAPPIQTSLVEVANERPPKQYLVTRVWNQWLLSLTTRLAQAANILKVTRVTAQTASIAATAFSTTIGAGLYRVTWFAHVVQAATTSSSLTVTMGFTDGGIACSQTGPAMTGNTVFTTQSGTLMVRCDQATPLTYATTYASTGATPMKYNLDLVVEQLA
jgi:hypothetical protein